jgi:hypothetical protein
VQVSIVRNNMKVLVELNLEVDIPEDAHLDGDSPTKEWLWTERRDQILKAMPLSRSYSSSKSCQTYDTPKKLLLLDSISRAQRQHLLMQEVSVGARSRDSEGKQSLPHYALVRLLLCSTVFYNQCSI